MADPPPYPDAGDDTEQQQARGVPRWRVVVGIGAAAVLIALVAVLHLTGVVGPE